MHPSYVGFYAFLAWCPIWAMAMILFLVADVILHIGRDILEGLGYQISYTSKIGDLLLSGGILIAATILQRGTVAPPAWIMNGVTQLGLAVVGVGIGAIVYICTYDARSAKAMDLYHDLVIIPLYLFCAITLVPVILRGGRWYEIVVSACFVILWLLLVRYDAVNSRLDQRKWLARHHNLKLR